MAEIIKYKASEVMFHIRHDLRELPNEKSPGNQSIDPALTKENYSLIEGRCRTAREANRYRRKLEGELFQYGRKDLVHAVEIVVQCPADCPAEQEEDFFFETYRYICGTLPMGERCVIVAQMHKDERHRSPSGEMISKDHLHVMYVPGVPDKKHEGFRYRLCADELTRKANLRSFHPGLQEHLNAAGITATVYSKNARNGKTISFSVAQMKEITAKTGIVFDHSLTMDELCSLISADILHGKQLAAANEQVRQAGVHEAALQDKVHELQGRLEEKSQELEKARSRLNLLSKEIESLQKEADADRTQEKDRIWGSGTGWGSSSGWGSGTGRMREEEKTL